MQRTPAAVRSGRPAGRSATRPAGVRRTSPGSHRYPQPVYRRLVAVFLASCLFGVVDATLWNGTSTFWIANMSAAYLALALAAGASVARRGAPAAMFIAAASTTVALAAFYAWRVETQHLDVYSAQQQFLRYALPGLICSPVFGWLGHRWAGRRQPLALLPLALALALEHTAWQRHLGFSPGPATPWRVEIALGIGLAVAALLAVAMRRGPPPDRSRTLG
jgi:hypothetical protein